MIFDLTFLLLKHDNGLSCGTGGQVPCPAMTKGTRYLSPCPYSMSSSFLASSSSASFGVSSPDSAWWMDDCAMSDILEYCG